MVGGPGPGVVEGPMCRSDIESLGRGWPMKSLVFPLIINIYDVILWRHICQLNCNKTLWCNMIFGNDQRFVKLSQNRSPEASYFLFWNFAWKEFLGDPTFSSSLNVSPRSAINFLTEIKRCRSDFQYCWHWLTWLASSVSILHSDLITFTTKRNRGIFMFHWLLVAPQRASSRRFPF